MSRRSGPSRRLWVSLLLGVAVLVGAGLYVRDWLAPSRPGRAEAEPSASATTSASTFAKATRSEISHGQFEHVPLLRPAGAVQQFVLLMSGDETPSATDRALAQSMVDRGAMVALVSLPPFYRAIAAASAKCVYAGGAIENFARYVQAQEQLPSYILPLLVGTGADGGSFVYAVLAQAPANSFTGALSLGFCPRLPLVLPMCNYNALRSQAAEGSAVRLLPPPAALGAAWTVLEAEGGGSCSAAAQGFVRQLPDASWVAAAASAASSAASPSNASSPPAASTAALPPGFDAAFAALAARRAPIQAPPAALSDLPVVELPAAGGGSRLAIIVSGDGGWADIDKRVGAALVKEGVAVVGLDSLRYFWSARTPEGLAADIDRMIRFYAARWKRSDVILVGYSQGADVLPFAFNRLPAPTQAMVRYTALLGPGLKASFEFHVSNWVGAGGDRPIEPELRRMSGVSTLCVYGVDEAKDSLCPQLTAANARVLGLPGGHHLGGDYEALVAKILGSMPH